ncbi:hypothetical protein LEP1GSC202_0440 [Leptospira yanagawae serovar Saopaulo str. Sao Paulo = ATCC 700523]|uniref:Uncharacterized protein n=1 Tax=Leptospira yanagawae serovar Saopaulo str. Sao Paulo = ATCC 700523 TaxID=1249483 RepID=A0A5E8HHF3_9LEPT|nr:hypothetical protein [Leptospira yanagawae]EOQ90754.1 hypothetical protein LEP1GSC202_0440 [Leptospira yanagawae serovar Saopaulo str. Sao Paulo = ATCC 700523]
MMQILGAEKFIDTNLEYLNENLNYPLVKLNKQRGNTKYRFDKVNERIQLSVTFDTAEVWYIFDKNKKDWLFDLSHSVSKDSNGDLFCEECKSPKFKNESEFYLYYLQKDLLRIQKSYFQNDSYLFYYRNRNREIYFSEFIKKDKLLIELKKKNLEKIISIEKVVI